MADGRITLQGLSKRFGRGDSAVVAVDDLSVEVLPGRVTGFLGPNGAGKTTTLRCLLGLVQPSSGTAHFDGVPYEQLPDPARTVGAALEATGFYPGRRAEDHLAVVAAAAGIPQRRVGEVLELVGLASARHRRVGEYSLGMRQRLALATGLLGDPHYLLLDEPANGLDPQGIAWLRDFLRYLAGEGRTVLVSSHVLAEVQQTADDVVIIARGRLVAAQPLAALHLGGASVRVISPTPDALEAALLQALPQASTSRDGQAVIATGVTAAQVGSAAFAAGVELHELAPRTTDLEELFLQLTAPPPPGEGSP